MWKKIRKYMPLISFLLEQFFKLFLENTKEYLAIETNEQTLGEQS